MPKEKIKLVIASTTSTQNSGLLDILSPEYEKSTKYDVKVEIIAVGTGKAIRVAKKGEADMLFVHDPFRDLDSLSSDNHFFAFQGFAAFEYLCNSTDDDSEWARFRPTLRSLAAAYNIDWDSDPANWQAVRMTDRQVKELLGTVERQIEDAGKARDAAAKAAGVDKAAAKGLKRSVAGLGSSAKALKGSFAKQAPVGESVSGLLAKAKSVGETAGTLGIADAAKGAWAPLEKSLATLAGAFGKS